MPQVDGFHFIFLVNKRGHTFMEPPSQQKSLQLPPPYWTLTHTYPSDSDQNNFTMKLFGRKAKDPKGREPVRKSLIRGMVPQLEASDVSTTSSDFDTDYATFHSEQFLAEKESWEIEVKGSPKKPKRLGALVKKMNCSKSNRNEDEFSDLYIMPTMPMILLHEAADSKSPRRARGSLQQEHYSTEDRPVVISIQANDTPATPKKYEVKSVRHFRRESKEDRTVRLNSDSTTRASKGIQESRSHSVEMIHESPSDRKCGNSTKLRHRDVQSTPSTNDDLITPQDAARRSKWRRGLENRWRQVETIPSLCDEDDDEDDTIDDGARSVGVDTVETGRTGFTGHTSQSATTGYTTEMTEVSDDSEDTQSTSYLRKRPIYSPRRPSKVPLPQKTSLLAGVAEDLGVVAQMIIADGRALFTCTADTTKEIVSQCRPSP